MMFLIHSRSNRIAQPAVAFALILCRDGPSARALSHELYCAINGAEVKGETEYAVSQVCMAL